MSLTEEFKQCSLKEGRFSRINMSRGEKKPSFGEMEKVAKALSEYLDKVGAEIKPNMVKAMGEAYDVDVEGNSYLNANVGKWFALHINPYLKPCGIKAKNIKKAMTEHLESRDLDADYDEIRPICSNVRGGIASLIYYKDEEKLDQYLLGKLKEPKKVLEFIFNNE